MIGMKNKEKYPLGVIYITFDSHWILLQICITVDCGSVIVVIQASVAVMIGGVAICITQG